MSVAADLFGIAYLDAESFRNMADLFGVGMALAGYPDTEDGNAKLGRVLQAASRAIDAECARDFSPASRAEQHPLDLTTWRFKVNAPPVAEIVSCTVRYAIDGTLSIDPDKIYVNNQQRYCEITRVLDGSLTLMETIGTEIGPVVEVVYKSLQSVPTHVKLACGFQAGHLINTGFVDKILPPNFGKVDLDGLSINNKKAYRSAEEMSAGSFSAEVKKLLTQEIRFSVS